MAIIQCPECGQDISNKAKKCIHCGKILIENVDATRICAECGREISANSKECPFCGYEDEPSQNDMPVIKNEPKKINQKAIVAVAALTMIIVVGFLIFNFVSGSLNEDEQLAYQNAIEMKNMMRDPDSFRLYDDITLLKHYNDDGDIAYIYTIFRYGGANGYGGIENGQAIFRDDEYIMDYSDEPNSKDANYMQRLATKIDLINYKLSENPEKWEMLNIDVEKIKNKMGLKE